MSYLYRMPGAGAQYLQDKHYQHYLDRTRPKDRTPSKKIPSRYFATLSDQTIRKINKVIKKEITEDIRHIIADMSNSTSDS